MSIDVDREHLGGPAPARGHEPAGLEALDAAVGVAASVAKRHGGELRLRAGGDGSLVVELCFPIPAPPA